MTFVIFFEKKIQEYHQCVIQCGSRSGKDALSGLIWVQTVFKCLILAEEGLSVNTGGQIFKPSWLIKLSK